MPRVIGSTLVTNVALEVADVIARWAGQLSDKEITKALRAIGRLTSANCWYVTYHLRSVLETKLMLEQQCRKEKK